MQLRQKIASAFLEHHSPNTSCLNRSCFPTDTTKRRLCLSQHWSRTWYVILPGGSPLSSWEFQLQTMSEVNSTDIISRGLCKVTLLMTLSKELSILICYKSHIKLNKGTQSSKIFKNHSKVFLICEISTLNQTEPLPDPWLQTGKDIYWEQCYHWHWNCTWSRYQYTSR